VQKIFEENIDQAREKLEAQESIRKAKAKAEMDEEVRRRINRNKKTNDQHTMEKCEDMAKKKNLEVPPDKEPFPTVLNSSSKFIS
jgi:hypothetical protein